MTCHVLLHLRHLYLWSCLLCLGFALMESGKKAGDKKPNARGTIASTSQGDIGRSTRETLDDPHCEQCSAKGFGFIFLFSPVFGVTLAIASTSRRCYNLSTPRSERNISAGNHRERDVKWAD